MDELPSGDRAVYVFLEILAFCFALASVDALVARHWLASSGYFTFAVVLFVAGIKWPQIKQKLSKNPHGQAQPKIEIPPTPPQPLPSSSVSMPPAVHSETESQSEKRETVNVTPEYLTGFYREGHTSVQARKLAEAFLGKWMKVSGPLGDVLGNYDNQRMVVFSNRSIYTNDLVNMFFRDKKWFSKLSTLRRGDTITVIGQVTDVNNLEIWLNNCELEENEK
jgi:hypothetical protein